MVRREPFGEWVNVFYDPQQIDTATILDRIIQERCPDAKQTLSPDGTVLNPMIAAGDPIQIRVSLDDETTIKRSHLPEDWNLCNDPESPLSGQIVMTIATSPETKQGKHTFEIHFANEQKFSGTVEVVEQVGQH